MEYSQKYCLVAFITPRTIGDEFGMGNWPLHVTLADVFAINRQASDIDRKIAEVVADMPSIYVTAQNEAELGHTKVVLIEKTQDLQDLHERLVGLLERNGAIFNTPAFTHDGFLPHCTIQKSDRLHTGNTYQINEISLVDMFPNNDWRQRKILNIFTMTQMSN